MYNDELIKKRFPNGLSIAYKEGVDPSNLTDELIDGIFDVNKAEQIVNSYTDFLIQERIGNYANVVKELLKDFDIKKRNEIFPRINTLNLVENIREIYSIFDGNIDISNVKDILKTNDFMFTFSIKNIPKNYSYIRKQQFVHMEDLDKFYIGNSTDNMQDKVRKLIYTKSKIPKSIELLSIPYDNYNQYLLSENLRLIVKEKGLIDYNDFEKNKASTLFNHTLLENLNRIDKRSITDRISFIDNTPYKENFLGIRGLLNDILNKMNPYFINDLNNLSQTQEYKDFLDNLNTIKKWDKYEDEVERLSDLKDEFITRILFGTLAGTSLEAINYTYDDRVKEYLKRIKKNDLTEYNTRHLKLKDLKMATGDNMINFFDEKKFTGKNMPSFINSLKNKILVTYPESRKYLTVNRPLQTTLEDDDLIIEELNADILNIRPSEVIRNKVVKDTYILLDKINKADHKNKKALMKKLFKIVNYYLIQNDELTIQNYSQQLIDKNDKKENNKIINGRNIEIEQVARQMLKANGKYTFDEKMIYYLYNSNRLAHSVDFIGLFKGYEKNFVMNPNIKNERDKKRLLIKRYAFLNRFGIDTDFIDCSIDTYSDPSNENITIYNIIDRNTRLDERGKNRVFLSDTARDFTINYLKNKIDVEDFSIYQEINDKSIMKIIMALEEIRNNPNNSYEDYILNKEIIDSIELTTKERNALFATKTSLIHNLIKNTEKKVNKRLEDMTRRDKKKLYDEEGFIIEYQKDIENSVLPVLVCYDVKFHNSSFAVHIIDNDIDFDEEKLLKEQSIKYLKNVTGLIPSKDLEMYNIKYDENLISGFISDYNKINKIEANISNKMKFTYNYNKGETRDPKKLVRKYEDLSKEEKIINKLSGYNIRENDRNNKSVGRAAIEVIDNSLNNLMHDIVNHKNTVIYEDVQRSLFGEVYNVKLAGRLFNVPIENLVNYIDESSKYYNKISTDNKTK